MSDLTRRISDLLSTVPSVGADADARADWMDRKAAVFEAIAVKNPDLADEATAAATDARTMACRLRGDVDD